MRMTILLGLIVLASCGRDNQECKSKEHMRLECQAQTIPSYGRPYAVEVCNRTYSADRCY